MANKLNLKHISGWEVNIEFIGNVPSEVKDELVDKLIHYSTVKFSNSENENGGKNDASNDGKPV